MSKIRVLVVDDAVVVRRIVTDVLGADAEIEVVGAAANGKIALQKLTQVNPDLVTLDVEMPEMDGPTTLRALRKTHPKLPVIMFSTLTARGAATTLDCLAAGANDYVTKPANVGSVATAMERIRDELIPKIKALCGHKPPVKPAGTPAAPMAKPVALKPVVRTKALEAVVIGVSTGGPNALADVMPHIAENLPVPMLIVQHMPPVFTKMLAERLDAKSKVTVKEAAAGDVLKPGHVYIAPGDYHMTIEKVAGISRIKLNQDAQENSCRPAVDVLFRSAAAAFGPNVLAVVLTGMGQDGLHGGEVIRAAGGSMICQDQATSVVWGMPGFVAKAGLAEAVLPLNSIAPEINRRVLEHRPRQVA